MIAMVTERVVVGAIRVVNVNDASLCSNIYAMKYCSGHIIYFTLHSLRYSIIHAIKLQEFQITKDNQLVH